ncbi:hypothetical protein [Kitasatospora sp. NPDC094015]|uniref:hypothetical protein n=1 Tax=Kitasatospora sp. NPDC094015 TaxID=3155205 RepID=UPI00332D983B
MTEYQAAEYRPSRPGRPSEDGSEFVPASPFETVVPARQGRPEDQAAAEFVPAQVAAAPRGAEPEFVPAQPAPASGYPEGVTPALRVSAGPAGSEQVAAGPLGSVVAARKTSGDTLESRPADEAVPLEGASVSAGAQEFGARSTGVPPAEGRVPDGGSVAVAGRPAVAGQSTRAVPKSSGASAEGGSGQGFRVNPDQYRAAVPPMLAVSDRIAALHSALSSYLPGMEGNSPWGDDESGKQFAEGEKGYLHYSAQTLKALKGMPDGIRYIADGLKAMADGYDGSEGSATSDFSGDPEGAAVAPPPAYTPTQHIPAPVSMGHHPSTSGKH